MNLPIKELASSRSLAAEFKDLLHKLVELGCSDITIIPQEPVVAEIQGTMYALTKGKVSHGESIALLDEIYGSTGRSLIVSEPLDFAHEIVDAKRERSRFRFNVTNVFADGEFGCHFSIRVLDLTPPTPEAIGLTLEFILALNKDRGMILVGGATGDGKSTTLACILAVFLQHFPNKLVTYEAPIEYVYDTVPNKIGIAAQHEIGHGVKSFAGGLTNGMRQKPRYILFGEIRDSEGAEAATEGSNTGHLMAGTVHANSAADMIGRIVDFFPESVRRSKALDFIRNANVLIAQRLLPRIGGGKIAVREIFEFTNERRSALAEIPPEKWSTKIQQWLEEEGNDIASGIVRLANEGIIDKEWVQWSTR